MKISSLIIAGMLMAASLTQAQSHYPGQHAGKFVIQDQLKPVVYSFDLQSVRLLDGRKPVAGSALTFQAVREGITLRPLYDIHHQRYVVYWQIE